MHSRSCACSSFIFVLAGFTVPVASAVIARTGEQAIVEVDTSSDTPSTLSWQSAFWALMALALNNIAQPSGHILGIPEQWSCVYKASPVTSLVEIGFVVYELVRGFCKRGYDGNIRKAVRGLETTMIDILDTKYPSRKAQSDHGARESGQARSTLRIALFVLGALPQTLKLFACRGIVFTQILATCYLISFCYDEFMMYLDTRLPCSESSPSDSELRLSDHFTEISSMYLFSCLSSTAVGIKGMLSAADVTPDDFSATLCFIQEICTAVPLLCVGLCILRGHELIEFKKPWPQRRDDLLVELLWTLYVACMVIASIIFNFVSPLRLDKEGRAVKGTGFTQVHQVYVCFLEVGLQTVLVLEAQYDDKLSSRLLSIGFFPHTELVKFVAMCMVGYRYGYTSEGTYRPSWTDKFG